MGYDVIGDVHGQDGKLTALLARLGYRIKDGAYRHPAGRVAVFVGDLIDRGPGQREVIDTVRRMVDAGSAKVVMGNHEFNAIGYVTRGEDGEFLRPNTPKNRKQHEAFLSQMKEGSDLHRDVIDWFKTLPLYLDLGGIRVVHAWWDDAAVKKLEGCYWDSQGRMSDEFLHGSHAEDSPLKAARKLLTCGVEWDLPGGCTFADKEGHSHGEARLAVWRHWAKRLPEMALVPRGREDAVPDIEVPPEFALGPIEGSPILFGHHWFSGEVTLETTKVACLDWSAARDGPLVAYRWDGEPELSNDKLVWVG